MHLHVEQAKFMREIANGELSNITEKQLNNSR